MAWSVEILNTGEESVIGAALLKGAVETASTLGMEVNVSNGYHGKSDWLVLFGVGEERRNRARLKQIERGKHVLCWDLGYIKAGKDPKTAYLRMSVDHNHPWRDFDRTPSDSSRLDQLGVTLRNDYEANGPVIVIGMGPKSRRHLGLNDWERHALLDAAHRFPGRKILYRPKPMLKRGEKINRDTHINWETTTLDRIEDALRGASRVITRHSNVAVDACIANIPVECEDGAAYWLYRNWSNPDESARMDFLRRLAWWQYRIDEQAEAWRFLQTVYG